MRSAPGTAGIAISRWPCWRMPGRPCGMTVSRRWCRGAVRELSERVYTGPPGPPLNLKSPPADNVPVRKSEDYYHISLPYSKVYTRSSLMPASDPGSLGDRRLSPWESMRQRHVSFMEPFARERMTGPLDM